MRKSILCLRHFQFSTFSLVHFEPLDLTLPGLFLMQMDRDIDLINSKAGVETGPILDAIDIV